MKLTKTIRLRLLLLWGIFLMTLVGTTAFSQTVNVSGTVVSQTTSAPVSGATITVKGADHSAVAGSDGKFTINASTDDVLVISSIGYFDQEVKIGSGELYIRLQESESQLENVVVIGYGTQKKKLVTGANLQVKGDDIQKQNTTNALQALQGQAPGVQITSYSGQPGSGMNVIIRGKGTIGNSSPLFVVDGVQAGDISYLNPSPAKRLRLS